MTKKKAVFCYGSNDIIQIRERCENQNIIARTAYLEKYVRIFGGASKRWQDGAVASVVSHPQGKLFGSVVDLTEKEVEKLDVFEGCSSIDPENCESNIYRRITVKVKTVPGNQKFGIEDVGSFVDEFADVFIMNNPYSKWIRIPSNNYLLACERNIKQYWTLHDEAKTFDNASRDFSMLIRRMANEDEISFGKKFVIEGIYESNNLVKKYESLE